MASLRQIRSRLRSITNTKQIMRAMQLVSGSKLKRAQDRLISAREVLTFLDGLLQRLLADTPGLDHPLCSVQEAGPSALVIFTSDAGLCGSYNTNLLQLAESTLRRESPHRTEVVYIGKKGYRYFTKRGYQAAEAHLDLAGRPDPAKADVIGRALMARFQSGRVRSVDLLYSTFLSASAYRPTVLRWLPIALHQRGGQGAGDAGGEHTGPAPRAPHPTPQPTGDYIIEPSPAAVFADLLPRWALAKFQLVMLEAFTSEHSARMIAMKSATDNAEELLKSLTLTRNKIRQAAITKEISEIVGTVEALK